jgi:glyoxylase-like metal-dependent hydrolase (beta-lactamase superfamily II)
MKPLDFDRSFDVTPGVCMEISPLIRRVLCGNPSPYTFKGTSTFIIGHGKVAIIDPGPEDEAHLAALLNAVRGETVTHIFVTHTHMDHSPLALKLKATTGAPIFAGDSLPSAMPDGLRLDASIDRQFVADHKLAQGEEIGGKGWTIKAVATPGHMSNHMSFALREEQALFCGDHVMAWATSVIAPPDGNMGQYMDSLRLLLKRDDAVFHPGHGPSRRDPKPLVRAYLAHRKMREAAIYQRLKAGERTPEEIVKSVYSDIDPRLHGAAALSTRAHLDHLVEQGKARLAEGVYEACGN